MSPRRRPLIVVYEGRGVGTFVTTANKLSLAIEFDTQRAFEIPTVTITKKVDGNGSSLV